MIKSMKKIVLGVLLVLISAVSAQAQFYVGGTLGVSINSIKIQDESNTTQTYGIAPEFGYNINSVWAVGVSLGAAYTSVGGDEGNDFTAFSVSPYVRTTFAHVNKAHFFADAAFSYVNTKEHTFHTHTDGWGVGLCPGVLIDLSRHLQLVGRTTLMQYSESGKQPYKVKQTGFFVGNNLELGVQFNF